MDPAKAARIEKLMDSGRVAFDPGDAVTFLHPAGGGRYFGTVADDDAGALVGVTYLAPGTGPRRQYVSVPRWMVRPDLPEGHLPQGDF